MWRATASGATATCTTSSLGVGGHGITAVYSGDTNNAASTSHAHARAKCRRVSAHHATGDRHGRPRRATDGHEHRRAGQQQFTVSQATARTDGSVNFSLTVPGAGAIDVLETAGKSSQAARAGLP